MRCMYVFILLICFSFVAAPVYAAEASTVAPKAAGKKAEPAAVKPTTTPAEKAKTAPKAAPPRAKANAKNGGKTMKENAWYKDGAPQAGRGTLWEKGQPAESLTVDRTEMGKAKRQAERAERAEQLRREKLEASAKPQALDTQKGIDSALKEISAYERQPADGSEAGLNKPGGPSFQVTKENSSWRNDASGPGTVGQDVMVTRRNVVGAYADVVKNDDLRVSVGPELHIPDTETTSNHIAPQHPESSTLGVGMKWQWDF